MKSTTELPADYTALSRRAAELTSELTKLRPIMRGSIVYLGKGTRQPYFSVNIAGRTRLIYLGSERVALAREALANYRKMQKLLTELTLINMQLLKLHKTLPTTGVEQNISNALYLPDEV